MGRKTWAAESAEKLNQATAEAARILSDDLAVLSAAMKACLLAADKAQDKYQRAHLFSDAMDLVDAAAKLGETIGKVKGESRQRISVERHAERTANASQSAFNSDASSTPTSTQSTEICDSGARRTGEGG